MSTMFEQIADIIRKTLDKPDLVLTPETRADDVPMWDSLKNVDIYTTVESELGAYFSPEEVDAMHDVNLGGFVRMVEANLARLNVVRK